MAVDDVGPKVSVITAAFNSIRFLEATYESLQAQSERDWEWCIHDDASRDGTKELLLKIAENDSRVRATFGNVNVGAARARNSCIVRARGTYLAFLDSDDLWMPDKLVTQVAVMDLGKDFTFTCYRTIREDGEPTGITVDQRGKAKVNYCDMLRKRATLGCSTVVLRRSAIGSLLMPDIRSGQDYAFWLSLLRAGLVAERLDAPLTSYRIVAGSLSRNKIKKAKRQWHIYRTLEGCSLLSSSVYFAYYVKNAVFRR